MKRKYIRAWDQADSPLLWVEMIYIGDTKKMKEHIGFRYDDHYFIGENQTAIYYENLESRETAKKFGAIKYKDPKFIKYFCEKTKEIEEKLNKTAKNIPKIGLSKKELLELFKKFFEQYADLVGFYRFCRPEFYEKVIEELKDKLPEPQEENLSLLLSNKFDKLKVDSKMQQIAIGLKQVGKRRFAMHNTWVNTYNEAKKLFEEIGKRIGLSSIEVQSCTSKEIIESLTSGKSPDKKQIQDRINNFKLTYKKEFFELTIPGDKIEAEEIPVTELKGRSACHGKVKGRVTLLAESLAGTQKQAMQKMPKGNILVTVMTAPDMTLAINKAAAIVTDEGGLLCHAAVVSREFKIPCIVGTGNATKVLKNGDLVEVDATNGVVKKLS